MSDHRSTNRWQINRQVKIKLAGAESYADCFVRDINLKGAQISLAIKLPKDTFQRLSLLLTDDFVLNVEVWVVWQKTIEERNVYGLYFSKIQDSDKERIYQFIRQYFSGQLKQQWWQDQDKKN